MTALPDPSASRAVLIGTSRYTHSSLDDLPAVASNLDALAGLLRSPDVWGLPAENCIVVSNPATVVEMIGPIARAAAETTDTLLVYYAGHGLVARLASELHLALTGSEQPNTSYTAVPFGLVREELAGTRAERQVVVLDCCYSGRALGRMAGGDSAEIVADEAVIEGTYLIAAASETKTAVSVPGERHTAFTAELLTVLRRGLAGKGPYLDLDTLYREIEASLRAKQRPLPQSRVRNTAGRLAFRNRAFNDRHQHWRELITEAERTARTLAKPEHAFGWIIAGLAAHDPAEAEQLARTIKKRKNREFRLSQLAEVIAGTDSADAERIAGTITDPLSRAETLAKIVEASAGQDPVAAERIARTITFPRQWAAALRNVAEALIERSPGRAQELLAEVERYIRTIADPQERAAELQANAVALIKHDLGQAMDLMTEAERLRAPTMTSDLYTRYLKVQEALGVLAEQAPAEAERFVHAMLAEASPDDRVSMLTSVVGDLAERAPAAAERIAYTFNDPELRFLRIKEFIGTLAGRDPDAAERVARTITNPKTLGPTLRTIAQALVEHNPDHANALLAEAEHAIRAHGEPGELVMELSAVAQVLARLDPTRAISLLDEAERLIPVALDAGTRAAVAAKDIFFRNAETTAAHHKFYFLKAMAAGWAELDPSRTAELLTEAKHHDQLRALGPLVMQDGIIRTLAKRDSTASVRVARLFSGGFAQAMAFEAIMEVLAPQDAAEAERIARTITDPRSQSRALQIIIEALIERDPPEAERIARSLPDPHAKIHMLGLLAISVP
ncbi:caspase family protein [Streptomyces sp. 2A115]|uniref:caspase family protein n=1 Tax=Streptomyces sp. 2A115 TaxID=3457439 RepID=UPI003FD25D82